MESLKMNRLPKQQKGASAIATIIFLALLGYAIYIGIQYVPQAIESKAIDSILSSIQMDNTTDRITNEQEAKTRLVKLLQVNEMNDMANSFKVKTEKGAITIAFSYDRELNLVFKKRPMHYEKSLVLK